MKKLKLSIDSLCVESFVSEAPRGQEGTVQGHDQGTIVRTCDPTCEPTCATWRCVC